MLLWFVGPTVALVWIVFRSPVLDYRVVAGAAMLPVLEVAVGGPWLLHTLVGAAVALTVVMVATRRRRLVRRRALGIPIGLFVHLVLDGAWTRAELFWWPFLGPGGLGAGGLPEFDRAPVVIIALELAGVGALTWCWHAFRLHEPERRQELIRTGALGRGLTGA